MNVTATERKRRHPEVPEIKDPKKFPRRRPVEDPPARPEDRTPVEDPPGKPYQSQRRHDHTARLPHAGNQQILPVRNQATGIRTSAQRGR